MNHKTILATTYAVNPFKGSEDGMGWNFVCQIARSNKVIAVTRENNREHIEKYMIENPDNVYQNISFLYFDLPFWMRFWKKGGKGAMLYYWMWQIGVVSFIKKQNITFDIVHNLNFHNDWTPSYLWKLNKPFVWGPIGHHPLIPKQYLKPYKRTYWLKDRLRWVVKKYFWTISPALRKTVRKADFIFCMNESVPEVLNLKNKDYAIVPSVATEDFGFDSYQEKKKFTLISAGRLIPLKGYDLSILAFAEFIKDLPDSQKEQCELIIIGRGPELEFYKKLVSQNSITNYVKFKDWIERKDLMQLFRTSSAFLFPSHEGAGMVVAEAMSFGLPVICLDNCGPGEFIDTDCGFAIPQQEYEKTFKGLGEAISTFYHDSSLREKMSKNARVKFEEKFHWNNRGDLLNTVYLNI
jgi:glycosyltransferase involved in cell wall biosynthesis